MGVFYKSHGCDSACEEEHGEEHNDNCTCLGCHEYHKDEGMENYDGLECCTDAIDWHIEDLKDWCAKHRQPFCDVDNTWCSQCEQEKMKKEYDFEKKLGPVIENDIDHYLEVKHEND